MLPCNLESDRICVENVLEWPDMCEHWFNYLAGDNITSSSDSGLRHVLKLWHQSTCLTMLSLVPIFRIDEGLQV